MLRRSFSIVRLMLAALLPLALVGCAQDGPNSPNLASFAGRQLTWTSTSSSGSAVGPYSYYGPSTTLSCPYVTQVTKSKTIGAGGGTIFFGGHVLYVPAGALSSPVTITATRLAGTSVEVDFAPHGLHFDAPAKLTLDYSYCSPPPDFSLQLVYVEGSNALELENSYTDPVEGELHGDLNHFSTYVIAY